MQSAIYDEALTAGETWEVTFVAVKDEQDLTLPAGLGIPWTLNNSVPIAVNATGATVQAALEGAGPGIGPRQLTVTGGAGGPYHITWLHLTPTGALHLPLLPSVTGIVVVQTPLPLTGVTAELQARVDADTLTPLFTLTSPSGGIVVTEATGTVAITLAATVSAALSIPVGTVLVAVYDLQLTDTSVTPATVHYPVMGRLTIRKAITHA